jgi:hypothetical protein
MKAHAKIIAESLFLVVASSPESYETRIVAGSGLLEAWRMDLFGASQPDPDEQADMEKRLNDPDEWHQVNDIPTCFEIICGEEGTLTFYRLTEAGPTIEIIAKQRDKIAAQEVDLNLLRDEIHRLQRVIIADHEAVQAGEAVLRAAAEATPKEGFDTQAIIAKARQLVEGAHSGACPDSALILALAAQVKCLRATAQKEGA